MTKKPSRKKVKKQAPSPPPAKSFLADFAERRTTITIMAFVAVNTLLCLSLFDPKLHTGGDSASYVLLSESILTVGDGYAQSLEPGVAQPHTQYPPGYPMMLAPVTAIFGHDFVMLKMLSVLFCAGSVLVFALLVRKQSDPVLWLFLSLAFAVSPLVVDYSHWILSEAPFLFFTLLALYFLQDDDEAEEMGSPFWLGLLTAAWAYYVRSIGVLLLVAVSLGYLARRKWKKFFVHGVVTATLTLPWLVRNKLLKGEATPYVQQFLLRSVYDPEAGYVGLSGMVARFFVNVRIYAARELPRAFVGSDSSWAGTSLIQGMTVVLCGFMVVGFIHTVRRRWGPTEVYFSLSCVAVLLFEEVVSDVRYLLPLVPLVLIYVADGLAVAARAARWTKGMSVLPVTAMILVATIGFSAQAIRIPANLDMLSRYGAGDQYAGYHPNWRTFFEAADWVKANTPPDAVVTVRKPRLFNLWTDRRVKLYPFITDPDSVLAVVMTTDYVVIDQVSGTTGRYLVPAIEKEVERFTAVFRTGEPWSWVLMVSR